MCLDLQIFLLQCPTLIFSSEILILFLLHSRSRVLFYTVSNLLPKVAVTKVWALFFNFLDPLKHIYVDF